MFGIWIYRKSSLQSKEQREKITRVINEEYSSLGDITWREGICLAHFLALIVLWVTRDPAKAGGWGVLFPKGWDSLSIPDTCKYNIPSISSRIIVIWRKDIAHPSNYMALYQKYSTNSNSFGSCVLVGAQLQNRVNGQRFVFVFFTIFVWWLIIIPRLIII